MIVCCLAAVLLGSCERPCDPSPQIVIESLRFEEVSGDHVVAIGSWEPALLSDVQPVWAPKEPRPWTPWALVRIECRREWSECTESWAQLVADEHGEKPLGLIPQFTRYDIAEWSGPKIRATGIFREQVPVQLSIDVSTKIVRRENLDERGRSDGSDGWRLK